MTGLAGVVLFCIGLGSLLVDALIRWRLRRRVRQIERLEDALRLIALELAEANCHARAANRLAASRQAGGRMPLTEVLLAIAYSQGDLKTYPDIPTPETAP